jgi:ribosome biogenesis GTPase
MPAHRNSTSTDTSQTATPGLVIVNYGKSMLVEDKAGSLYRCVARRSLGTIVCGDRVSWQHSDKQAGVITAIAPRRNTLARADGSDRQRPLAANIDQIMIVAAPEPPLEHFLIDKYTVAAELARTQPQLVINKVDLLDADARGRLDSTLAVYADAGYPVIHTSAKQNTGIEQLAGQLAGRASILVGQSGVGKSSLIKRLLPDLDIAIGRLSEASGQGRHTTTTTTLYHLPHGGDLIDSPGVRDFRLGQVDPDELAAGFREFRRHLGKCRFNDCRHVTEPDCAVIAAAARGEISDRRLESYRRLLASGA